MHGQRRGVGEQVGGAIILSLVLVWGLVTALGLRLIEAILEIRVLAVLQGISSSALSDGVSGSKGPARSFGMSAARMQHAEEVHRKRMPSDAWARQPSKPTWNVTGPS